jgi:hypothetical protein
MSSQPGRSVPSVTPPARDNETPQPALPAAALTSAPFVTSASPPKSSRSVFVTVAVTALIGGSLGVLLVVKLLGGGPAHDPAALQTGSAIIAPAGSSTVTPSAATSAVLAPIASAALLPTPSASVAPTAHPKPGKPAPGPAPTHTTPAKPPPPSSDPGY